MIPLSAISSNRLTWSKLSNNCGSEIRLGDEIIGTLRRPSAWCFRFEATTPQGNWTFRRRGFLSSEIVDATTKQPIAVFKPGWSGGRGTLTFADGQAFYMKCDGWWRRVWTVTTDSGEPVLSLHTRDKSVELSGGSLDQGNPYATRISLLIMFTLYRIRQAEEDAAAAVVVAAIS